MAKHIRLNIADIYITPLDKEKNKTDCELELLRQIFGREVVLSHDCSGKPTINIEGKYISISHSNDWLAIAISNQPIGIDIEQLHERLQRVKHMFLNSSELEQLQPLTLRKLAICWSAKEAIYKIANDIAGALGENIQLDIKQIKCGSNEFSAIIKNKCYSLEIVDVNDIYEVILAWEY